MDKLLLIFCVYLCYHLHSSHGCQMEDVVQWLEPQSFQFKDTHKGLIISRATTNIEAIDRADFFDGLNRGPYLELNLKDSVFTVSTTDAFAEYEEYETLASIRLTVTFRCTGGSTRSLVFMFGIIDTNNHAPVFKPSEPYNFPLALPVPPGFKVSGCDHLVVRDVDLTTSAIIFSIQDNPYFEIVYHGQTQSKEFGASIRTKTLIRSLPDSLSFQISATDVDETTDDPRTSLATVNILADNAFRLPEQPIFSQAFYKAHYSEEPDIVLQEYISLRQGYDDEVKFGIRGEYADFFDLVGNNNRLSFRVKSPLTEDVSKPQILLVVTAEREFTSEASATVVIFMPEAPILIFESTLYEGQVVDNILKAPSLIITQGYGDIRNINIISEYSSYFKTTRKDNMVLLSMSPLPTTVIRENNVLNLQVVATTNRNATASTIVVLDIIKDDYITPTFEKTMYEGNYDPDTGLVLDPIVLSRGYDDTVQINLKGDHANYFEKAQNDAVIKLSASIPQQVWSEGSLMITVEATKPRTVGGNTAVYINLPAARELTFEAPYYIGSLENNDLTLESIVLRHGYAPGVSFKLSGEFAIYFTTRNIENRVTISLQTQIPETVILDNSGMMLTLSAIGLNALTANTNVLLNIIKDDHTTPVFEKKMYNGTYSATGLVIEPIKIIQGLDDTVKYTLFGDYSELFEVKLEGQTISVNGTVPTQIWPEKILFLTLHATKPRTVGAHAIIQIYLPKAREIRFEKSSYIGSLRNPVIAIEEIILSTGYSSDLEFMVTGEYAHFFDIINADNKVSMILKTNLPEHILLENNLIIVKLSASGLHAITAFTTIVLDIQKDDTTTPTFSRTIYEGIYKDSSNIYAENIALIQGYDETVSFGLQGDHAQYFKMDSVGNNITISLKSAIPEEIIFNEKRLLLNMFAEKDLTVGASAVVSFQFPAELTEPTVMRFSKTTYEAILEKETFKVTERIILETGFKKDTKFILSGNFAQQFALENSQNIVTILMRNTISEEVLQMQKFIILQIDAYHDKAVPVTASLIIDVIKSDASISPVFEKPFYSGTFTKVNGLKFDEEIRLVSGYEDTVQFELEGDVSEWFSVQINGNSIFILENVDTEIPDEVLELNNQLLFAIVANKPGTDGGRAAISISLPKASISLRFSENYYKGYIEEGNLNLDIITLNESYSADDIKFNLIGDYNDFFQLSNKNGSILIEKSKELPSTVYENYNVLILTLQARIDHLEIYTTLIFEIKSNPEFNNTALSFEKTYYAGFYSKISNLVFDSVMTINGKIEDQIAFNLEGDDATWFDLKIMSENSVTLNLKNNIPPEVMTNNTKLIFVIRATKFGSVPARATIVISLTNENTEPKILGFEKISYSGSIDKDSHINLVPIILNEGYSDQVLFTLHGELASYFKLESNGPTVILIKHSNTPEDLIPSSGIIILELFASAPSAVPTFATIVLADERADDTPISEQLSFAETYYTGRFTIQDGLNFNYLVTLVSGYHKNVVFALEGDDSVWFGLDRRSDKSVALTIISHIPPAILENKKKLIFVIMATRVGSLPARATIVISLSDVGSPTDPFVTFDKLIYNGVVRNGTITHEPITISGFDGTSIKIVGQHSDHFEQSLMNDKVVITLKSSTVFPNVSNIALELQANLARAVLLLNIERSETPVLPTVAFSSSSYVMKVDIIHIGLIGQVQATADNGESVKYSLLIDNDHLRNRLSVDSDGHLRLAAPASSGAYSFRALATTAVSGASATVPVHLTVEAVTICGDNIVMPPLIILERDEEEPHRNLVVLNETTYPGCRFTVSNSWPQDQSWLYVDDSGLHTVAIDREHPSIAFMAQSQIQVELILTCEDDVTSRTKRSLHKADWLGPYDYGSNKWILTDKIPYNARRSLVNLIVNDINDNRPIFVDKELEPIAVGYPVADLEKIIVPRALAELKANDADVGENAALVYWSAEESLAVSPSTGFVHVRNNFNLQNNARLIVHATDRNGAGLTGNLELMVKLLEESRIAVITIQNVFLDDEKEILTNITKAVGYEVKSLRTIVVTESKLSRDTRDTSGVSLQLFVYGLIEREPVEVNQLTADIQNNNIFAVARTVSLEDHLEGNEICNLPRRDTGLLVATIVLSVLLVILIVVIAVWFFLKRRRNKIYEEFSDKNSLTASRNDSLEQPKVETVAKPRLNIEELKKSERRLQERLDVPVTQVSVQASKSNPTTLEAKVNITTPETQLPIVIQTIDKLKDSAEESDDGDEFGEKVKIRRKSVVTFNENVEKIIHVEDNPDNSDYEIFRF